MQPQKALNFWLEMRNNAEIAWSVAETFLKDCENSWRALEDKTSCALEELLFAVSLSPSGEGMIRQLLPELVSSQPVFRENLPIQFSRYATPLAGKEMLPRENLRGLAQFVANPTSSRPKLWLGDLLQTASSDSNVQKVATLLKSNVPSSDLRVLTCNTWGLPPLGGFGSKQPRRFHKLAASLRDENFDIVALQEVWGLESMQLLNENLYPYISHDGRPGKLFGASGLVTLSRYPIVKQAFLPFSGVRGLEMLVRKGILYTRIELPSGTMLDLFNLHLMSEPERINRLCISRSAWRRLRQQQLRQVEEWINRHHHHPALLMIMGDFNLPDVDPDYEQILNLGVHDFYRERHRFVPGFNSERDEEFLGYTFDPHRNPLARNPMSQPERIDYILGNASGTQVPIVSANRMFVDDVVSDHYGVAATMTFVND